MASAVGEAPGSRLVTAVAAPANAPFASVVADLSVDGFSGLGFALRFRVAAARAAVFFRATFGAAFLRADTFFFFGAVRFLVVLFLLSFLLAARFADRFRVAFFAT